MSNSDGDEISEEIATKVDNLISQVSQQTNIGADIDEVDGIEGDIDEVNQIGDVIITGEGDFRQKDLIQSINHRFLPTPIHRVGIDILQEMPRYLSDTVISKQLPIGLVGPDHYSYWAWTAAVASFVQDRYVLMESDPDDFNSPFDKFRDLLSEYYSLVHLVLLPIRHQQMDSRTRVYFTSMNPSVGNLDEKQALRFAGNNGFRLLEGLVRRHSSSINLDGTPKEDELPIKKQWRSPNDRDPPEHTEPGDFLDYSDELHMWRYYSTLSESTKDTLDYINDMNRDVFDTDDLIRKFGKDEDIKSEIKKQSSYTKNFFDILAKKRNYTLHVQGTTQISGVLVLNLCSLIFWDAISEIDYEEIRDELLTRELEMYVRSPDTEMVQQSATNEMSNSMPTIQPDSFDRQEPTDFYPLYHHQQAEIMAHMQQQMGQ